MCAAWFILYFYFRTYIIILFSATVIVLIWAFFIFFFFSRGGRRTQFPNHTSFRSSLSSATTNSSFKSGIRRSQFFLSFLNYMHKKMVTYPLFYIMCCWFCVDSPPHYENAINSKTFPSVIILDPKMLEHQDDAPPTYSSISLKWKIRCT